MLRKNYAEIRLVTSISLKFSINIALTFVIWFPNFCFFFLLFFVSRSVFSDSMGCFSRIFGACVAMFVLRASRKNGPKRLKLLHTHTHTHSLCVYVCQYLRKCKRTNLVSLHSLTPFLCSYLSQFLCYLIECTVCVAFIFGFFFHLSLAHSCVSISIDDSQTFIPILLSSFYFIHSLAKMLCQIYLFFVVLRSMPNKNIFG